MSNSVPTMADIEQAKKDMTDVNTFTLSDDNNFTDNTGTNRLTITGIINKADTAISDFETEAATAIEETLREAVLEAGLKIIETDSNTISISADDHLKHFVCTSNNPVNVTVNAPIETATGQVLKGMLVFFTQLGDGLVSLNGASGISFVYPEDSSPNTFSKGSTIAVESMSATKWIISGNLGY